MPDLTKKLLEIQIPLVRVYYIHTKYILSLTLNEQLIVGGIGVI